MPELPEAERARAQIEKVLGREIVAVDDRDTYVCRPHAPGEIADALIGHRLTKALRRGKFLWAETDGGPGARAAPRHGRARSSSTASRTSAWDRFVLEFADGSRLALHDRRRLGRALINPDFDHVGPDAALISRDAFRERVGRGSMALKARLLDQKSISGVGNLLADETLWRARLIARRPAGELSDGGARPPAPRRCAPPRATRSPRAACTRATSSRTASAARRARAAGRRVERATIGGRTTFWCPNCQP